MEDAPEKTEPNSEVNTPETEIIEAPQIRGLPTIEYYLKTYARSCAGNDRKAAQLFKDYESGDKMIRLKRELMMVSQGKVGDDTLLRIVGPGRKNTFKSYLQWANFLVSSLNAAR